MTTELNYFILGKEESIKASQFTVEILRRFVITSFNELVESSGKVEALAALKPYMRMAMHFTWNEVKKAMNPQGDGLDVMLLTFMFGQATVVPFDKLTGEIKEKGGVGTVHECMFRDAPPEMCVFISHFGTEETANIVNPDYECIFTHHLTAGDPYCRYVFKKRSERLTNLEDLGRTVATMPRFEMPAEKRFAMTIWALSSWWDMITSSFIELHGSEKAVEVLSANARDLGRDIGHGLMMLNKDLGTDIEDVGELVRSLGMALNQVSIGGTISEHRFINEISACALQTHPREVCSQWNEFLGSLVETLNPSSRFQYDQMMTKGGASCQWTIDSK